MYNYKLEIENIINHFKSTYLINNHWRIEFDINGKCINKNCAIPDYGDISPYLLHFGEEKFVKQMYSNALKKCKNSIYHGHGGGKLFFNHDWLLGLIDSYNFTNDSFYLDNAKIASDYIIDNYFHKYFLLDEPISKKSLSSFLGKSNPFSGGYIELFLELYSICKDQKYLNISEKVVNSWTSTKGYKTTGLFSIMNSIRFPFISLLFSQLSKTNVILFKSNTNFLYSIIDLYLLTKKNTYKEVLENWFDGFKFYLFDNGKVYRYLGSDRKSRGFKFQKNFNNWRR